MTSASGTPTLLHNGRFDGISDSINWKVSHIHCECARGAIAITIDASDDGGVHLPEMGCVYYSG